MAKVNKDKIDLNTISQAHGALPPLQAQVNEILGFKSAYKEANVEEYMAKINAMTESDLHEHAIERGEVPIHVRSLLVDRLKRAFLLDRSRLIYRKVK